MKRAPIRLAVFGRVDSDGTQLVYIQVIWRGRRLGGGVRFFPSEGEVVPGLVNRTLVDSMWRDLRHLLRKEMFGDNYRERWAMRRMRTSELQFWDRSIGQYLPPLDREHQRRRLVRELVSKYPEPA